MPTSPKKKPVAKKPASKKGGAGSMFDLFGSSTPVSKNNKPQSPSSGAVLVYVCIKAEPKKHFTFIEETNTEKTDQLDNAQDEARLVTFYTEVSKYASERRNAEKGCLSYNVIRDGHIFHFYELYENEAARAEHGKEENIKPFRQLKTAAGFSRGCTIINKTYWVIEKYSEDKPLPAPKNSS